MDDPKSTDLSIVPVKPDAALVATLTHEFDFVGASGASYEAYSFAGKPLLETPTFKLAITKLPSGQFGLTMIASDPKHNWRIETQQHVLHTLQEMAAFEDAETKTDKPFFGALFPTMVDTMDTGEDSPRAGLVMGFHPEIASYKQLVPLSVVLKGGKRVDLQTAVWMLSKALKLMDFVHAMGFAINWIDEDNYLIETARHGVFILNWMESIEEASVDEQKTDIKDLANLVWAAAGGTEKSNPPHDEKIMDKAGYDNFVAFLKRLMSEPNTAGNEMDALLVLADSIWERTTFPGVRTADGKKRPFHEFVTY